MAKLLAIFTCDPDAQRWLCKQAKQVRKQMRELVDDGSHSASAWFLPEGIRVQLFKVEADGVEELQSIDVHYHDENGNRIEVIDGDDGEQIRDN